MATLASSFLIGSSSFIANNEGNHKSLYEFEFLPVPTTAYGVSCPWPIELAALGCLNNLCILLGITLPPSFFLLDLLLV